jgi:hypothetical protein
MVLTDLREGSSEAAPTNPIFDLGYLILAAGSTTPIQGVGYPLFRWFWTTRDIKRNSRGVRIKRSQSADLSRRVVSSNLGSSS